MVSYQSSLDFDINFEQRTNISTLSMFLLYNIQSSWKDFRLMWEPEQYEGVDRIFLPADMVWRPDLTIYNSFDYANGGSDRSILSSPYNVWLD